MDRYQALRETARQSVHGETRLSAGRQGGEAARRRVLRQLERLVAALPAEDRGPLACRAGCSFCCHLRVAATAPEVFGLLDYLRQTLAPLDFEAFAARVRAVAAEVQALPDARLLAVNLPCPVLVDGRCSAYPARPLNCRSYHSLDRAACEQAFEHPDQDLGHPQLAPLARVHAGVQAGWIGGLAEAGHDARQFELVTALAEALDDPDCRRRFEHREPVFQSARGLR